MMETKKVLITGVNGSIGSEIANSFKKEGYLVYGIDQKVSEHNIDHFFHLDLNKFVSDPVYFKEWSNKLLSEIRDLDVLINNAAVQILDSVSNIKLKDWQETLNVNLTAPLLLSKIFFDQLKAKSGCIINIASIHQNLTKKNFVSYATSKSALVGLTKAMAVDLQDEIRVNSISPAAIATPMLLAGFDGNEKALEELKSLHPVQRIGYPDEVAKLSLYIANDHNGFLHGSNITLDGGISSVLHDLE